MCVAGEGSEGSGIRKTEEQESQGEESGAIWPLWEWLMKFGGEQWCFLLNFKLSAQLC